VSGRNQSSTGRVRRSARPPSSGHAPLRVHNLGSGSSGNALLIASGDAAILVDCGVERRLLISGLAAAGFEPASLAAVLLSHEHGDHARSIPLLAKADIGVIASEGTMKAVGGAPGDRIQRIAAGRDVQIGGYSIAALPVHHDAREPCGFTITIAGRRVTVLTDLGRTDDALIEAVAESDLIVLEANHDTELLRNGPYPPQLKRRILSGQGHLSNTAAAVFLADALRQSRKQPTIWLAHLSRTNNRPGLARETVLATLHARGLAARVEAMSRNGASQTWEVDRDYPCQLQLPW
jgi:phosphoribosyl 1,2-cyclic phosphodiesterase